MEVADDLERLEQTLLTGSVRKDAARVSALLADEFREFGSSGSVYSKAEIVASLQAEKEADIVMKAFACRTVADGVALVTYRSERATGKDGVIAALRSSLWIFREGRWQMVFHQGTRVNDDASQV